MIIITDLDPVDCDDTAADCVDWAVLAFERVAVLVMFAVAGAAATYLYAVAFVPYQYSLDHRYWHLYVAAAAAYEYAVAFGAQDLKLISVLSKYLVGIKFCASLPRR